MNPRFLPPRAAYVHVPFCRHRCGYCNFTLVAGRDDLINSFLQAIGDELTQLETPREVDTMFLGGGTPSYLPATDLQRLFDMLREWLPLAGGCEFTLEANPSDLSPDTVHRLAENGVTRVSVGAQSFHTEKLALLERQHGAQDIKSAVERVQNAGLQVSLDLIFGVPGESASDWRHDLETAAALQPHHLSTYGLTFERGTRFWSRLQRGELQPLTDSREAELYETAISLLATAGYQHYEVSNFCLPGHACRHNLNYWRGGTYFAFGPGAASHVAGKRQVNHRSTTTYIKRVLSGQSPVAESESLSDEEAAKERLVFGLRELGGVDCQRFAAETGFSVEQLAGDAIASLLANGLLATAENKQLQVTRAGLLVCDSIATQLL